MFTLWWHPIVFVFVLGIMLVFFCTALGVCISKIIDAKAKAQVEITTSVFKNEIEYLDKYFDKVMTRIENMLDKYLASKLKEKD